MKRLVSLSLICFCAIPGFSQVKEHIATRTYSPPKIDGMLDDQSWVNIPVADDFITNEPVFGKPPGQQTEVKFLYDDDAIYLAYYLYDSLPSKIMVGLSERDRNILEDEIIIGIDTYNDKSSAFRFQLTAAGVQSDRLMSPFITRIDRSWDAVWESAVTTDEYGWYAELKIPLSALRFPKKQIQIWGIQFGRYVGRTGEFTTWSPVNPDIGGGPVRQWGIVTNLADIKPKVRLSLWPYLTIGAQRNPLTTQPDQTEFSTKLFYSGGMDLKYGINQSYTLDMTLVPDFSQIQSDNTILNLTPFEIKYEERRQFFTEGSDMFNKAGIFYSRRIGAVPSGYSLVSNQLTSNEKITDNPSIIRLLNATKISGRTNKGFGVGFLNAITENIYAQVYNESTQDSRKILTEPLTNYNILVIDQSLKNNSKLGFINTNTLRSGDAIDANVSALDCIFNTKDNLYALTGTAIYSYRRGVDLYNGRQTGYNYKVDFGKVSRNFRFEFFHAAISANYNPNDLGVLTETNLMQNFIALKYYSFKPIWKLLNWNSILSYTHTNTLNDLSFQRGDIDWTSYFLLRNFMNANLSLSGNPGNSIDIYEPRTADLYFVRPKSLRVNFRIATDTRKKFQVQTSGTTRWFEYPHGHFYFDYGVALTYRLGNKIILSTTSNYSRHKNNQGYAAKTIMNNVVFGLRQEHTVENIILLQYLLSPYANLSLRVRDYWSKVRYDEYYSLESDGSLKLRDYNGNEDINLNLFNADMIYSWQYGPGSYLSLSWKASLNVNNKSRSDEYFTSLAQAIETPKNSALTIRLIYYLDYIRLRKALQ